MELLKKFEHIQHANNKNSKIREVVHCYSSKKAIKELPLSKKSLKELEVLVLNKLTPYAPENSEIDFKILAFRGDFKGLYKSIEFLVHHLKNINSLIKSYDSHYKMAKITVLPSGIYIHFFELETKRIRDGLKMKLKKSLKGLPLKIVLKGNKFNVLYFINDHYIANSKSFKKPDYAMTSRRRGELNA